MNCADCGNSKLAIYDTRHVGNHVVRKRKCLKCDEKFYTIESYMTEEELATIEEIKREKNHNGEVR
jgi:transcriptional regulator NrdR family protein